MNYLTHLLLAYEDIGIPPTATRRTTISPVERFPFHGCLRRPRRARLGASHKRGDFEPSPRAVAYGWPVRKLVVLLVTGMRTGGHIVGGTKQSDSWRWASASSWNTRPHSSQRYASPSSVVTVRTMTRLVVPACPKPSGVTGRDRGDPGIDFTRRRPAPATRPPLPPSVRSIQPSRVDRGPAGRA